MVRTKLFCTAVVLLLISANSGYGFDDIFRTHVLFQQPSGIQPRSVSLGDLDGDSDLDIMVAESASTRFVWYENNGGTAPSFAKQTIGSGRRTPTNVFSADINGDNFMDVVSVSVIDDQISYYANDGQPNPSWNNVVVNIDPTPFGDAIEGHSNDPRMASAGDLDGDGDLDIAVASVDDDKIAWYENDDNGTTWTPHTLTDTMDGARAVWIGDLDGDNDMDVIGGPWFSNTLYWYENDGNPEPGFTERVMATFPENPIPLPSLEFSDERDEPIEDGLMWRMLTVDMDNDGDTDVIAARRNQGVLEWYENDGADVPQWTRHTILEGINYAGKSIYPMDVDMDGHIDLAFASRAKSEIAWYRNQGDAESFEEYILYSGIEDPNNPTDSINFGARSVYAGDLDNDGDTDFAWIGLSSGVVAWEENLTIQLHADFDRDGDVDGADRAIWEASYGVNAGGDADGDGDSDGDDFMIWQRQHSGNLTGSITSAVNTVPEPSSLLLATTMALFAGCRRKRN